MQHPKTGRNTQHTHVSRNKRVDHSKMAEIKKETKLYYYFRIILIRDKQAMVILREMTEQRLSNVYN